MIKTTIERTFPHHNSTRFQQGELYANSKSNGKTIILCTKSSDTQLTGVALCSSSGGFLASNDSDWTSDHFEIFHGTLTIES